MTTNEEGFLVLSIDNSDEPTKNFLKNIQNETVILKLSISKQVTSLLFSQSCLFLTFILQKKKHLEFEQGYTK